MHSPNGTPPARSRAVLFMGDLAVFARQARLFDAAWSRGYTPLVVVSENTDLDRLEEVRRDRTHALASVADVVQVPDARPATVLAAVRGLVSRYDIRGVMSVGEVFVEPVGVLADCLGLPGAGSAASLICRDKVLQRMAAPHYAPRWQVVPFAQRPAFTLAGDEFPVVVKPAGRFYSSGVKRVSDQLDLTATLATYAREETVLVESLVVGREFSVEALVQNGEVLWSAVTGKETNQHVGPYFTETSHTCPAVLDTEDAQALLAAHADVVRAVRFQDGITHGEYRMTDDGVVLMEIAARLPGDAITFLWELATGQPIEPVMLDLALGLPTSYPPPRRRARQRFVDHPHGVLADVTADGLPVSWPSRDDRWPRLEPRQAAAPPEARGVLVARAPGDRLGVQVDSEQRSACVIVDGPLDGDLDAVTSAAVARVRVTVEPGP